ncbi:MAG: hypothetical protein ACXWV2_03955 [Chitinophagaceae bacterium]
MYASIKLRNFTITIATFCCATLSFGQSSKEQDFALTLRNVVMALSQRDSLSLSKYIDRKTGVYILNRIGVYDTFEHLAAIGFSDTTYPNTPFYDKVKLSTIKYSKLPAYDCKTEKWTKTGTFVDTSRIDHLLSKIARDPNREFKKVPAPTINEIYNLENKSRRVVIADNNWNELIIYLSYINNKWILTIIDKVTCDCSV